MVVLMVLVGAAAAARLLGLAGVSALDSTADALRVGLGAMLCLTATARLGARRRDLVRMVPPRLPHPTALVGVTGVAEAVLAAMLLADVATRWAAVALAALLVAMFPANVHAARAGVGLGGRPPTPLPRRTVMQGVFVAAAVAVAAAA